MAKTTGDTKIDRSGMMLDTIEDEAIYILKQIGRNINNINLISLTKHFRYYADHSGFIKITVDFNNSIVADINWSLYSIGGSKFLWELNVKDPNKLQGDKFDDPIGYLDASKVLEILTAISKVSYL